MTTEHEVKAAILKEFGIRSDLRLFNNPVGEAWMGKTVSQTNGQIILRYPRRVRFGLVPGSSDLIGFRTVVVTPDMVGQRIAQFVAIETKGPTGRATKDQKNFLRVVDESGGIAVLARNIADVETKIVQATTRNHWSCPDRTNCSHCPMRDMDCPFLTVIQPPEN
jgi:hypothetical protein